jgi:hypothetical protein
LAALVYGALLRGVAILIPALDADSVPDQNFAAGFGGVGHRKTISA